MTKAREAETVKIQLSTKQCNLVAELLQDYSELTDALERLRKRVKGKPVFDAGITLSNEKDDHDFHTVTIPSDVAFEAVKEQRPRVSVQLRQYGVEAV